jgi:hypothetical protein
MCRSSRQKSQQQKAFFVAMQQTADFRILFNLSDAVENLYNSLWDCELKQFNLKGNI